RFHRIKYPPWCKLPWTSGTGTEWAAHPDPYQSIRCGNFGTLSRTRKDCRAGGWLPATPGRIGPFPGFAAICAVGTNGAGIALSWGSARAHGIGGMIRRPDSRHELNLAFSISAWSFSIPLISAGLVALSRADFSSRRASVLYSL